MKPLPVGEPSFVNIVTKGALYVDKTELIYQLADFGGYFFLSRPRRFGKSLLVSTMEELFLGHQALFEGLWIYKKWDWKPYPVLKLDFNTINFKDKGLERALSEEFDAIATTYQLELKSVNGKDKFKELVIKLGERGKVAVLIDEYDKPIISYLDNFKQADANREILKNVYGVLKGLDVIKHIHIVFITGVSKFSKVSLFSDLNHLTDLTLHGDYAALAGITHEEMLTYFDDYIDRVAKKFNADPQLLIDRIKEWYNGYSWDGKTKVCNPFSLLSFFESKQFRNFWFATGTTTFLVKAILEQQLRLASFEQRQVTPAFFDKFSLTNIDPEVLLFQTGYLTIKEITYRNFAPKNYLLTYPNEEVRNSLMSNFFEEYAQQRTSIIGGTILQLEKAILENDLVAFFGHFEVIFADVSNRILQQYIKKKQFGLWEAYYESLVYVTINLLGLSIEHEVQTNKGYIDIVLQSDTHVYIMEFKRGTAADALQQIKQREYWQKFQMLGKTILLVGVGFDVTERNIGDWKVKTVEEILLI